jgi:N6-L-threonylcarbamoyladenine synthase
MNILGIETSCDETAVAVVRNGKEILSSVVYSQLDEHKPWYGVVPEIAARTHLTKINNLYKEALQESNCTLDDIDAIAVTQGPGLAGSLIVGIVFAKSLALISKKPIIAVNHLEAHLYSPHLTTDVPFPHLALLASGGHTLLIEVKSLHEYVIHGTTIDDAVGEAFDKVAKMLDLGYPGGPIIDKMAKSGNPHAFEFPKVYFKDADNLYNFSFSGLKTAVYYKFKDIVSELSKQDKHNIAASFQENAIGILVEKISKLAETTGINTVIASGGVASNSLLRSKMENNSNLNAIFPPMSLCMDNAAMVAGLGYHLAKQNEYASDDFIPFTRMIRKGKAGPPVIAVK